jgi:hypothetical protein
MQRSQREKVKAIRRLCFFATNENFIAADAGQLSLNTVGHFEVVPALNSQTHLTQFGDSQF